MLIFTKIEKTQNHCLRLVLDDYESGYGNLIKRVVPPEWKLRGYEF